jgi:SAM-dependent methyltransferase
MGLTSVEQRIKLNFDCVVCHEQCHFVIDLGLHGFADSFYTSREAARNAFTAPLICVWCKSCELLQLGGETEDHNRYNAVDYSYTSSNSSFARSHWDGLARELLSGMTVPQRVLEIGSNDGYLLKQFQSKGHEVLGIDASERMVSLANESGIPSVQGIFGKEMAVGLEGGYDLILANNVFNHSNSPLDFLKEVARQLTPEGRFVFEVPSLEVMLESGRYDQIYLEHITYWSAKASSTILRKAGLELTGNDLVNYHGGSLRLTASKIRTPQTSWKRSPLSQGNLGLRELDSFAAKVMASKDITRGRLSKVWDTTNGKIAGVGAAAKANTAINYLGLEDFLCFITDASDKKIGKFAPKSGLEIMEDRALLSEGIEHAILLAWNLSDDLETKLKEISPRMEVSTL